MTDDLIGQVIRDYQIREKIGEGGQSRVYRAFQVSKSREVAIKVMLPEHRDDPDLLARFQYEAVIAFRLQHPRIVPLYDYWHDEQGIWMVMRFMEGGSLRGKLKVGGWTSERVAKMLDQLADGLATAHKRKVVHRDLKPDNILFDNEENAHVTDFGAAKRLAAQAITRMDILIGSPAYLSPEQIRKDEITPAADIYTLGITLYEALTGEHPFIGAKSQMQLVMKHLQNALPPLHEKRPDLPEAVNAVIQTATAKKPVERYPDVLALAYSFRIATKA